MYCENLDKYLDDLMAYGATKLPSVEAELWRSEVYKNCLNQIGQKSYAENLEANINFIHRTHIIDHLLPRLVELAEVQFGKRVKHNDVYNICRLVRPGDLSEGFRGHFDSHLFTLVTPINIPNFKSIEKGGQLHYFPKARNQPNNEMNNIFLKAIYKKYNSEKGFDKLSLRKHRFIDDFQDYRPLLFIGNTTFHGNAQVQADSNDNRMTILTHFFDTSPKYGVGAIMRNLRRR